MKKIVICLALMLLSNTSFAGPGSILGGKPMGGGTAHYAAFGWPSLAYEWWHAGSPDWAIGGELVYGDWSGEFSNVDVGFALNVPFRWHMRQSGRADIGFRFAPGALIGSNDAPGGDQLVTAIRGDMGVPITVSLDNRINLITGVTVPFTVMFVENVDAYVIVPIMPRIGVEFAASQSISPLIMLELGPTIAIGDFGTKLELGVRAWIGAVFW
jgi:hypothetical protein